MDDIDFEQDFGKSATVGPKTSGEGYSKKKKKGSYVTTLKCYQCFKNSLYTQRAQAAVSCQYNILVIGSTNVLFIAVILPFLLWYIICSSHILYLFC